ncbi:hypothetical protein AAF712_004006 [Marasmius tenuissimus]|uniref:Cytochrome P450 n=1 Tax=Marasmius tenuissimus TaxID=585030 RepID=A0ABR3A5T0_9AGAR
MHTIAAVAFIGLAAVTIQTIYRIFFHPLRKFPGPWTAAATYYYRGYYDVVKGGGWVEHIIELHKRYGPVVRVSPHELHFSDPNAFDDIHVVTKPVKYHYFYKALPTEDAIVRVIDPKEASKRRVRIGSYFSRRAVLQLEKSIQTIIEKLIHQLTSESYTDGTGPADLFYAYRATTMDIIMSYLFAQEFGALDYPGFAHPLLPLSGLMQKLPESIVRKMNPFLVPLLDQTHYIAGKVEELTSEVRKGEMGHSGDDRKAIFDVWLNKTNSGDPWIVPKSQIIDECASMQFAGSDTVGNACMMGSFHLLKNRMVLMKLRRELDALDEEQMTYETLEKLPCLSAVIKESLRMSFGVASPLPRVVGPSGSTIGGVTVPPRTVVSSASYVVHTNPSVFPDPHEFIPERWLDNKELDKYLVSFSKGPRICLGINLAWAELYLIFANVFRRLDFELYDTTEEDLTWKDCFLPLFTGKHLRAFVKKRMA